MHCEYNEIDNVIIQKLWDKIRATFAERDDVLKLCLQMERMEKALYQKNRSSVSGIVSGNSDKISRPGCDGIVQLDYDEWIESDCIDQDGKQITVYNDSKNAVSTAAAATIIKSLRKDIANRNKIFQIVFDVDKDDHPVVPDVDYNVIYLTPADKKNPGNHWIEWIAIPKRPGGPRKIKPYTWERLGSSDVDLTGICNDIKSINEELIRLNKKIHTHSSKLAEAILEKAVKPLEDLREYVNSQEYIQYVFNKFPQAALGQDGLMTSGMFAVLSNLAVWAANDHKMPGGGAIGADTVIHMLHKSGVPVKDLQTKLHHVCADCADDLI